MRVQSCRPATGHAQGTSPEAAERDVTTLGKLCENERLYDVMGFVMRGWQGSGPGTRGDAREGGATRGREGQMPCTLPTARQIRMT